MTVCAYENSFWEQEAQRSGIQVYNELNASLGYTSSCLKKPEQQQQNQTKNR